jgi:Tfp pilus assembly protein PilN
MAQHLNLYDASLRPPRVWVTPARVALALALVLGLTYAAAWQVRSQAQAASQRSVGLQAQLQQLAGAAAGASSGDDPAQSEEIAKLKGRIAALQSVLQTQIAEPDGREGAAALLNALSQAAPGDVWLDAVHWQAPRAQQPPALTLEGRMLDPRRLPVYLRRLEAQPALAGQRLAQVTVEPSTEVLGSAPSTQKFSQFALRSQAKGAQR